VLKRVTFNTVGMCCLSSRYGAGPEEAVAGPTFHGVLMTICLFDD